MIENEYMLDMLLYKMSAISCTSSDTIISIISVSGYCQLQSTEPLTRRKGIRGFNPSLRFRYLRR